MKRRKQLRKDSTERASHEGEGARGLLGSAPWFDRRLVALMLAVKTLVFIFGVHCYYLLVSRSLPSYYDWLTIWNRWDAPHYLDIARQGYVTTGEERLWLVFYPLYPWLARAISVFTGRDHLVAALLVSTVASLAAGLLLYRLARLDDDEAVARNAVWFLFIFPTSYFLHVPYTESLFIALAVGCFLAARRNVWWLAGLLGAFAGLTRVNGLLLIPAVAAEAFTQYRATRRLDPRWLWIALAFAGFGLYLVINKYVAGDWFAFSEIARTHWSKELSAPWTGIANITKNMSERTVAETQLVVGQEYLFLALGLVCALWCWKQTRASYAVWATLNWLLWTSTSYILSTPRYTLILFPIYILFARLAARSFFWGRVITVWSLLFLAIFVSQYVRGEWAF